MAVLNQCIGLTALIVVASSVWAKTPVDVPFSKTAIVVDGIADETSWDLAEFKPLDNVLIGETTPSKEDFLGRYKLLWDESYLYLMLEVQDDHLSDRYADPLEKYWDEECVEVFIDEDASGGEHTYNHNAFAYHVALDNQVVDIDIDEAPKLFNDHIESRWQRTAEKTTWELAIRVFDDSFTYGQKTQPVTLTAEKEIGFMLAYCDADGQGFREHFMGSEPLKGDMRNMGYRDASVFGKLILRKP